MTRKIIFSTALIALTAGLPVTAQASAECDTVMMVGTQHFAPAVVAACRPYFQSLADNAAAPGTFATPRPPVVIVPSTSGTGG